MLIRPKVVAFRDGTFGIRKPTVLGYRYYDLRSGCYWWGRGCKFFSDCKGDRERVKLALRNMNDKGCVVPVEYL